MIKFKNKILDLINERYGKSMPSIVEKYYINLFHYLKKDGNVFFTILQYIILFTHLISVGILYLVGVILYIFLIIF